MSPGQVKALLGDIGLEHESEDDTCFMVFCPFHSNMHSPAMWIAKDTGKFGCFNEDCGKRGEFADLVESVMHYNIFQAKRLIEKREGAEQTYEEIMAEITANSDELPEFDSDLLVKMRKAFLNSQEAQNYMKSRGFTETTMDYFNIGYDPNLDMVLVPMYETTGYPIGVIGRSRAGEKRFKNSVDLPSKKSLWNINNAKKAGAEKLILVESSFDAMRIHQAGFPNVCATLGSIYSDYHITQVGRHFDGLLLMTDADDAGLKFAERIAKKSRKNNIFCYRGMYSATEIFPHSAKDVNDQNPDGSLMVSDNEIRQCIQNAEMILT